MIVQGLAEKKLQERESDTKTPGFKSIEAYFRAEEKSVHKNEYHDGIIIPMAGANLIHNLLASKAMILIGMFIKEKKLPFKVSNSDTKVRIETFNQFVYPDAVVIYEKGEYFEDRKDTITNPLMIVEVLSASSKKRDRTTKFDMYRTIPSFKEYMLIYQDERRVTVWSKQANGDWRPADYAGEEATAMLFSIPQCALPLAELYDGI